MGERSSISGALALCAGLVACDAQDSERELRVENERLRAHLAQLERQLASTPGGPSPAPVPSPATATATATAPADTALLEQLENLREELAREQSQRLEREREWLRYTSAFEALGGDALAHVPAFEPQVPTEACEDEAPAPAVAPEQLTRAAEVARALRTLLALEGVRGIDLLEAGRLGDGWIGPVVFRLLDERGRLVGSLGAQRLRLVGSRTARTLALVLEDGFEARGGVRTPFEPAPADDQRESFGVRRIEFDEIDPLPWVAAAPELFGGVELAAPVDDGQWNLTFVRASLNRLLRVDAARGYWRLKSVAGVCDGALRDVHLEQFDAEGKLERRLFADALRIERRERGVALVLEEGATVRGDERSPFLDGRYRIYLPRADQAEWNAAGLPGLSASPAPAARAQSPGASD